MAKPLLIPLQIQKNRKQDLRETYLHLAFTAAKKMEETQASLVTRWTHKLWSIRAVEYYAAWKRGDVLTPATARMHLEDIVLSEMSRSQKDKSYVSPHL